VAGLVEDNNGFLWVSTSEGRIAFIGGQLSRFDRQAGTFTSFSSIDGLPNIGFFIGALLKSRDGMLFFEGKAVLPPSTRKRFGKTSSDHRRWC
jgi:hypothetical protein